MQRNGFPPLNSCKRRGCPNCDAKRSAVITGQALERLLAFVHYRQWVLVVPKRLRYFLNHNPALAGELSRIFADEINRFLCQNTAGTPAQLHFIQRFGGALNLHIHVHAVVSDGVFSLTMNVLGRSDRMFDRAEILVFEGKSYRLKGRIELPEFKVPLSKKKKELVPS